MMDVALDHRRVDSQLAAATLYAAVDGKLNDAAMDGLQGLWRQSFDRGLKSRFFRCALGNAQAAEGPVAAGVGEMEGQLPVAEAVHLLEDQSSHYLLGAQASRTRSTLPLGRRAREVVKRQVVDAAVRVEQTGDRLQFLGMLHIQPGLGQ